MSNYCDSSPSFYQCGERVARKQHSCCECQAPILKGERYCYAAGRWDFGFATYRQHLLCEQACEVIRDYFVGGDCIGFGWLKEEFAELRADNWYPDRLWDKNPWRTLRDLMAKILWRERRAVRDARGEPAK